MCFYVIKIQTLVTYFKQANLPVLLEDMLSFSTNESVTLGPNSRNVDSLNPLYAIAIALGVGSFIAFLVASLVCHFIRKRSGPVWISKVTANSFI